MSEGGVSDSDERAKDWEMVSIISSNGSSGITTEPLDLDCENFIFPPCCHEGLPIETDVGYVQLGSNELRKPQLGSNDLQNLQLGSSYCRNSQLGSKDFGETAEENAESEAPGGCWFESQEVDDEGFQESQRFGEVEDLGVSEQGGNEGISEFGQNFELENDDEELEVGGGVEDWGWGFGYSGFKGLSGCEGWWKRQVDSLGQPNTFWSIAMAAALVGIVVLGHRWQHEKWKNKQIRQQICANEEKISELLCQVAQLKEAVSGRQKVTVIRSGSS